MFYSLARSLPFLFSTAFPPIRGDSQVTTEQHIEMHKEHREAQTQLTSWLDDIYMWRAENRQAFAWLSKIEAAIHENDVCLQKHSDLIDRQDRHIRQHEHEIVLQEQKHRFDDSTALVDEHDEFSARQIEARSAHASVGEKHRKQLVELKRLLNQIVE